MSERLELLRRARREAIAVPLDALLNDFDAITAMLTDAVPGWLHDELACEGVRIDQDRWGAWILSPLDD